MTREGTNAITRHQALRDLRQAFTTAGIDTAALDARVLLLAALDIGPMDLITEPDRSLTPEQSSLVSEYATRRLSREPVARILGEREFWGLPFGLSAETLIPRPDSETVVETALLLLPDRHASLRIADLGTGSGCLLVALLHEFPKAIGIGIDRSPGAARTAGINAGRNGVLSRSLFAVSDWSSALGKNFDLMVSNPPYIATAVVQSLDPEVREHDPYLALDGGTDGLDAYRAILTEAKRHLAPDGLLVLEIGYDQSDSVKDLGQFHGFRIVHFAADLAGRPRCLALKRT